jgi:hypothetical protein
VITGHFGPRPIQVAILNLLFGLLNGILHPSFGLWQIGKNQPLSLFFPVEVKETLSQAINIQSNFLLLDSFQFSPETAVWKYLKITLDILCSQLFLSAMLKVRHRGFPSDRFVPDFT